jgi:hypothetical protein
VARPRRRLALATPRIPQPHRQAHALSSLRLTSVSTPVAKPLPTRGTPPYLLTISPRTGTHAFSTDGYTYTWHTYWSCRHQPSFWKCNSTANDAYLGTATFSDRTIHAGCRERPSLVFAADGVTPIALVHGLEEITPPIPSHLILCYPIPSHPISCHLISSECATWQVNGLAPDPFGVNPPSGPSGSCRYATHDYAFTALQPLHTS